MRYNGFGLNIVGNLGVLLLAVFTPVVITGYSELQRAEVAAEAGNFQQAAYSYERAARLFIWQPELWEMAGRISFANQDIRGAIRQFENARKKNGLSDAGWKDFGLAYVRLSEPELALLAWKEGFQRFPADRQFYSYFSMAYRLLADFPSEQQALGEWIDSGKAGAAEHYRFGQLLMLGGSDRVLSELNLAAQMDADYGPASHTLNSAVALASLEEAPAVRYVILGRGLGMVGEWQLAALAFGQAVSMDPESAEALAWLGEARQQLHLDGRLQLDQALRLNSRSVIVRALRAQYWSRQGKYPQALAEYLLAAGIEPKNPAWQAAIGQSYANLADINSALMAYQRAADLAPKDASYWRLLAVFCAENGIHVEDIGLPAALRAVALAPEEPQARDALGWSYLASGRYALAEQTLIQITNSDPFLYFARVHLALTYLAQGKTDLAYFELIRVRAQNLDPLLSDYAQRLLEQYFP